MILSQRTLAFAPLRDTKGKHDATGAFQPEARRFLEHHGLSPSNLVLVDNGLPKSGMREAVLARIAETRRRTSAVVGETRAVVFFCHGWRKGMQFGFDLSTVLQLAQAVKDFAGDHAVVMFYSCSVGSGPGMNGDGGFADVLRDALCSVGAVWCSVTGHYTAGHCTMNPYANRFVGLGSAAGGIGGFTLVSRSNRALWAKWRAALKTGFRFDYPLLTAEEILKSLA